MAIIYDDLLTLDLATCRRLGFLTPGTWATGTVNWSRGGYRTAAVRLTTDTRNGADCVQLQYNISGEPHETNLTLRWHPSNLKPNTGYYYFVCPATGRSCRKLYLYGGQFVSRYAFRALYPQQAESHSKSNYFLGSPKLWAAYDRFNKLTSRPHRRETHRGRLTPWGRQVYKALAIIDQYKSMFEYSRP